MSKKILIVQTAFIGDVILITPLIRSVRKLYPNAVVHAMVVPAAVQLLENNPHLDGVLSFAKHSSSIRATYSILSCIKKEQYDLAITPHSSSRTHFLLWFSRIPVRIGFDRGILSSLLTHKIKHPSNMHKTQKNLRLLQFLSPASFSTASELFPSEADHSKAEKLLANLQTDSLIALAPGSIWATKCWPEEYYLALAQNLLTAGMAVVLIGGDSDRLICSRIAEATFCKYPRAKILNLAGQTNLLESAAVIAGCRLLICNDSGALHIANAMQTKVYAFFGPTVQSIGYYPYREGDRVFEMDLGCRPCGKHGGNKCPLGHHNCMKMISPEHVFAAVMQELGRH